MGINGVSSYANTYTYGNVKNENVKPSKNSEKNYYAGYTMNSANKFTVCHGRRYNSDKMIGRTEI